MGGKECKNLGELVNRQLKNSHFTASTCFTPENDAEGFQVLGRRRTVLVPAPVLKGVTDFVGEALL
jgi:hypothetical protein